MLCRRSEFSFRSSRFFFSVALIGAVKNVFKTLCMRVWSPGARVGQAWLNVEAMKGTLVVGPPDATFGGKGIGMGTLGFTKGDVGNGGNERSSVVSPGMRRIVTFGIKGALSIRNQFGGGASAIMCRERSRISCSLKMKKYQQREPVKLTSIPMARCR